MKSTKLILSFLFLSGIYYNAYSQDKSDAKFSRVATHQFGINAGFTTGIGFAYKYFPDKFGIQVVFSGLRTDTSWKDIMNVQEIVGNFIPYNTISDNLNSISQNYASVGLTGFMRLSDRKKVKLFSYISNHLLIYNNDKLYNIGGGVGLSFKTKISFSIMVGYQMYDALRRQNLYPTGEISFMYQMYRKTNKQKNN